MYLRFFDRFYKEVFSFEKRRNFRKCPTIFLTIFNQRNIQRKSTTITVRNKQRIVVFPGTPDWNLPFSASGNPLARIWLCRYYEPRADSPERAQKNDEHKTAFAIFWYS